MPDRTRPRADATLIAALLEDPGIGAGGGGDTSVGPAPTAPAGVGTGAGASAHPGLLSGAQVAGGTLGGGTLLYALDRLLQDPAGGGVPQVLAHLGPVLGVLYANAPVALLLMAGIWLYRRDQAQAARRGRRMFAAFARLAAEQSRTTAAVDGVHQAVQDLRSDVDARFEAAAEAMAGAESRLQEHSEQIRTVQETVEAHGEALRAADLLPRATTPPRKRPVPRKGVR